MTQEQIIITAAAVLLTLILTIIFYRLAIASSHVKRAAFDALQAEKTQLETTLGLTKADLVYAQQNQTEYKSKYDEKAKEFIVVNNEAVRRKAELENRDRALQEQLTEKQTLQQRFEQTQQELQTAIQRGTQLQSQQEALQQRLIEQQQTMTSYGDQLKKEFQLLADNVLASKAAQFNQQQESKLTDLLNPVRQKLEEFKTDIAQKFSTASTERTKLEEQVRIMAELNQKLSSQAENLTKALSSQVKHQGNWGEEILETILQHVGLKKDIHYYPQHTATNHEGETIRPDFVVRYPDDRYVIIDSKVSLIHFQRMVESTIADEQQTNLGLLVRSLKQHIEGLAGKQYHHINGSLDYVLLFVPVEGAFITAMQADHSLWQFAYDRKILLVSPTLLLSALKLIHELWKQDDVNRNANAMADKAGKLYDKLAGFADNFEAVGKKLEEASRSFDLAKGQLFTGKGNAMSQAAQMKVLGAKAGKQISGIEDTHEPES